MPEPRCVSASFGSKCVSNLDWFMFERICNLCHIIDAQVFRKMSTNDISLIKLFDLMNSFPVFIHYTFDGRLISKKKFDEKTFV